MKFITTGICLTLILLYVSSSAQKIASRKPYLFTDYPAAINCTPDQLNSLFAGRDITVSLSFPGNFTLQGEVISRAVKYNSLQTVAVKLPAFRNILFSVTKRDDEGREPVYTASLFNPDYADGYQLKRGSDNTYQLIKIETAKLLPTCNL